MDKPEFHPPHFYQNRSPYFLTARTAGGGRLLVGDAQRSIFRDVLRAAVPDYGITLHAWVVLADHYHLLLETSDVAPIHRFIQRLHGESAIRLNKLDQTPGRQVWYQYWDRCPRTERDFWAYFHYVHINPAKHGYVTLIQSEFAAEQVQAKLTAEMPLEVHQCLSQYPYSSYGYYLRRYGAEAMSDLWSRYPIPDYLEVDEP